MDRLQRWGVLIERVRCISLSKRRGRSICVDQPNPGCSSGRKLSIWTVQIKASQGTADAAGVHEGEPPLGYSRVIRCMNSTLVNPINEPTHTHYWIALRKAGWVGSPTAALPPLGGSPPSPHQHSDQPITGKIIFRGTSSPPLSGSSIDHWALVKGLNALHKRGARSAIWLATTFG